MTNEETNDTDIIIDGEVIETIETPIYTFTLSEKIIPDYRMARQVIEWIQSNLEELLDDDDKPVFGKVNTGFDENTIKTFGRKPVCDVYINHVEYEGDFDNQLPTKVHSIVLFYLKGANNHSYMKACELHDYIMQEFLTNDSFKELESLVKNTRIMNSDVHNQNIRGGFGVMGTFEIEHELY